MTTGITDIDWLDAKVCELSDKNIVLVALLKEALPHVEKMANVLATGPIAGPVEHLVNDIQSAILEIEK